MLRSNSKIIVWS